MMVALPSKCLCCGDARNSIGQNDGELFLLAMCAAYAIMIYDAE
jgi:hypothetical protein